MDKGRNIQSSKDAITLAIGGVIVNYSPNPSEILLVREEGIPGYIFPVVRVSQNKKIDRLSFQSEISQATGLTSLKLLLDLGTHERIDSTKVSWIITHYFLFETKSQEGSNNHKFATIRWFPSNNLPHIFWPEQQKIINENRLRLLKAPKND